MPARKKKLPCPCPKCGSKFGTVQMVFFNHIRKNKNLHRESRYEAWNKKSRPTHKWNGGGSHGVFRIGHYDSKSYAKTKKENERVDNIRTEKEKKEKLRTSQRRWCSFQSEILLFDDEFSVYQGLEKNKTLPLDDNIRFKVLERGWEMI